MKKGIAYIILLAALLQGCKEDVPTLFNEPDGIYFSASSDSLYYTFAKYPSRVKDTLKIPVTVLGNLSNADRTITIEKGAGDDVNATEGVHYKLLPPYILPAGKVSTVIPVLINRTGDLDSLTATFIIKLQSNESFQSGISSKAQYKIKIAYLQKPPSWGEFGLTYWAGNSSNFGTWTKTKYKLILDALYDPIGDTTVTEFPGLTTGTPAIYSQYRQVVKNYIRANYPGNYSTPEGTGATLRDPDANNKVIQLGPANY